MKLRLLLALLVAQFAVAQQRTCGTNAYMQSLMANPEMRQQYLDLQQQFENEIARLQNAQYHRDGQSTNNTNVLKRIPVAVHYPSVANSSTETVKNCW